MFLLFAISVLILWYTSGPTNWLISKLIIRFPILEKLLTCLPCTSFWLTFPIYAYWYWVPTPLHWPFYISALVTIISPIIEKIETRL